MNFYDNEFTKNENQLILTMLIGGFLITLLTIIPTDGQITQVDAMLISINVFYWALTIITINAVEHKATRRMLQSDKGVKKE